MSKEDGALVVINTDSASDATNLTQRQFFKDERDGISDDGSTVYVASRDNQVITVFDRDTTTGNLTFAQEVSIPSGQVESLELVGNRLYVSGSPIPSVRITNEGLLASLYNKAAYVFGSQDFNNDLVPVTTQRLTSINQDAGLGGFDDFDVSTAPTDQFSVVWEGQIDVANSVAGTDLDVTFFLTSHNNSRLFIDDTEEIDNINLTFSLFGPSKPDAPKTANSGALTLTPGVHDIRVEFVEFSENASISLDYQIAGQSRKTLEIGPSDESSAGILAYDLNANGQLLSSADSFISPVITNVDALVSSQDGTLLYILSRDDDSLFVNNAADLAGVQRIDASGETWSGLRALAVSDDDRFVYVVSDTSGTLSVFERQGNGLSVEPIQVLSETSGAQGLIGASSITIAKSTSGEELVYVSSESQSSIAVFQRDTTTGALAFLQVVSGLSGLDNATKVVAQGDNLYMASNEGFSAIDPGGLASFSINTTDSADLVPSVLDIQFSNLEELTIKTGADSDTIRQLNTAEVNTLTINSDNTGTGQGDTIDLANVSGTTTVTTGDGDDDISIQGGDDAILTVDGGEGTNEIQITDLSSTGTATVSVTTGDDPDSITVSNSTVEQLTIESGDEADTVKVVNTTVGDDDASVKTEGGNDTVILADIGGTSVVETGAGEDDIQIQSTGSTDDLTVNSGEGDDTFEVAGQQIDSSSIK